jgi:hypothetical protein
LQGDSEDKKYHLTKWVVFCHPRYKGGLPVHELEVKNMSLLGKFVAKLLTEDGI